MRKIVLFLLCAGIAAALAACGASGEELPAETLAGETVSSAETTALPEQDENPMLGAWQYEDHGRTEVMVFGEQQKLVMLSYRHREVLEPYMTFKDGEMWWTMAPDMFKDITRDADVADFRIYAVELEEGTDYYILDKNGEVFHTYGTNGCTYELAPDSLMLTYTNGRQTTMTVEFVDSDTVVLTEQADGEETVLTLTRADHLYAVMEYIN